MTMTTNTVRVQVMGSRCRAYTRDAAPRTRDVLLTPPTREEFAANQRRVARITGFDPGLVWTGDLAPVGQAVARVIDALSRVKDEAQQKQALSSAVVALADWGNGFETSEASPGPSDSLTFGGGQTTDRPETEFDVSTTATPEDINAANRAFCDRANRTATRDTSRGVTLPARGAHVTPADINRMNAEFSASLSSAQPYNRPWGKG
jgi:hypothetical protein